MGRGRRDLRLNVASTETSSAAGGWGVVVAICV
jgi:hypothetical protein